MSVPLTLEGGLEGQAIRSDGEVFYTILPRAYAPGSPVDMILSPQLPEQTPLSLSGKTQSCKKRPDGNFDVRLRLVNLRRKDRARLAAINT